MDCLIMEHMSATLMWKLLFQITLLILCCKLISTDDTYFNAEHLRNDVESGFNQDPDFKDSNSKMPSLKVTTGGLQMNPAVNNKTRKTNHLRAKRDIKEKHNLFSGSTSSYSASQINTSYASLQLNQTDRNRASLADQGSGASQKDYSAMSLVPNVPKNCDKNVHCEGEMVAPSIYIGGLFELDKSSGQSEHAASKLAIEHVNEQQIIPGYTIQMVANNTKCDPGYGADAFYDMMYRKPQLHMLIATSCSEVAQMLGEIVPYWNLVMISHASTSSVLSDREKYPSFFRLATADSSHNPARRSFLQHMGWRTVATIIQDKHSLSLANNDMINDLEAYNMSVKAALSFRDLGQDLHAKMLELKKTDARIIIGSFSEEAARHVFCQAFHLSLYGTRYVWMLLGSYVEKWWLFHTDRVGCTAEQLATVADGHFTVEDLSSIIGNGTSISGQTTHEFLELYESRNLPLPRSKNAQRAYDSIWTVALTLSKILNVTEDVIDDFTYKNGKQMYDLVLDVMSNLEFTGVSGPVSFDGPDRRGISVIEQTQEGESKRVALYFPENGSLLFHCDGCNSIIWKGGKIPVDSIIQIVKNEAIDTVAVVTICLTSLLGLIMAVSFLGFNIYHSDLKYIKLSSPKLNNVAVIGCVLVYASVMLLGIDDHILMSLNFKAICMGRAYLWTTGYSLAFGAMFFKTYRVHHIFRRANSSIVRSKLLKDTQLLLLVGVLLVLDSAVMALWIVLDPMDRQIRNLSSYQSRIDPDIYYIPQISSCNCKHLQKWMGSLYAYKGLLLLFGMYMAWETRNVQIAALNDSRYIGMNIYNVLISSVTVVVLSNVLTDNPTLSFILISTLINISTTVLLALLFFPKIYAIYQKKGSPVVTSSGMTIEGNTRRFVTDDKKELFYRAEVENRFLKRKLTQIEDEIARIESLLALSSNEFLHVRDSVPEILKSSSPNLKHKGLTPDSRSGCSRRNQGYSARIDDFTTIKKPDNESQRPLLSSQTTISSVERSSPPRGTVLQNPSVCQSSLPSTCETGGQGDELNADKDYEDMMSEMGPPGMLTLIFNKGHGDKSNSMENIAETDIIEACSRFKEFNNLDQNNVSRSENG